MRAKAYAALLLDLDGTVLGTDEKFTARVGQAIRLASQELPVCIASGRPAPEVTHYSSQLGLTMPHICDGGATIFDPVQGCPIWTSRPFSPTQATAVFTQLQQLQTHFIASYRGGSITSYAQIPDHDFTRITALQLEENNVEDLMDSLSSVPGLEVVKLFYASGSWGVNCSPAGVNKGYAAQQLAGFLGTQPSEFIAVGDSYNDLPLLEICGLRIVMGNAPTELKALADYVSPTVEQDGLAVAIEEFLLQT